MRPLDVLAEAWLALSGERRRSSLSLLGVAIGVAAVILLIGAGEGARRWLGGQFEFMGSDVIGVLPGKVETTGGMPGLVGVPHPLTLDDAEALRRGVPQIERVAPVLLGNETVEHADRSRQVIVFGSTVEIRALRRLELARGSFLPDEPWDRSVPVAVLGPTLADELFPSENPVGRIVRVGGWRMRVLGVLASQGVHFGIDMDETAFVPVATAMRMFDRDSLFRIALQVRRGADSGRVQERAAAILRERHGEEDFTVTTPDAILDALDSILGILTLALAGIASISLGVAGIGIMNVMLVSVAERRREIGLMKAVGAKPAQVLVLFLAEALLVAVAGGLAGTALGFAALRAAAWRFPDFPFPLPPWAAAAALGLAVTVALAFGAWPALRALRLDPVVALSRRAP